MGTKITAFTEQTALASGDLFVTVEDPSGSAVTKKISIDTFLNAVAILTALTSGYHATEDVMLILDNGTAKKTTLPNLFAGVEDFLSALTAVPAAADTVLIIDGGVAKYITVQNLNTRYVLLEPFSMATPNDIEVGDGTGFLHIPARLDGLSLVEIHAECATAPTDATITIQLSIGATDMLSTLLTIAATKTGSDETGGAGTIKSDGSEIVSENDLLEVDIDQVGSTLAGSGLMITLGFA